MAIVVMVIVVVTLGGVSTVGKVGTVGLQPVYVWQGFFATRTRWSPI